MDGDGASRIQVMASPPKHSPPTPSKPGSDREPLVSIGNQTSATTSARHSQQSKKRKASQDADNDEGPAVLATMLPANRSVMDAGSESYRAKELPGSPSYVRQVERNSSQRFRKDAGEKSPELKNSEGDEVDRISELADSHNINDVLRLTDAIHKEPASTDDEELGQVAVQDSASMSLAAVTDQSSYSLVLSRWLRSRSGYSPSTSILARQISARCKRCRQHVRVCNCAICVTCYNLADECSCQACINCCRVAHKCICKVCRICHEKGCLEMDSGCACYCGLCKRQYNLDQPLEPVCGCSWMEPWDMQKRTEHKARIANARWRRNDDLLREKMAERAQAWIMDNCPEYFAVSFMEETMALHEEDITGVYRLVCDDETMTVNGTHVLKIASGRLFRKYECEPTDPALYGVYEVDGKPLAILSTHVPEWKSTIPGQCLFAHKDTTESNEFWDFRTEYEVTEAEGWGAILNGIALLGSGLLWLGWRLLGPQFSGAKAIFAVKVSDLADDDTGVTGLEGLCQGLRRQHCCDSSEWIWDDCHPGNIGPFEGAFIDGYQETVNDWDEQMIDKLIFELKG